MQPEGLIYSILADMTNSSFCVCSGVFVVGENWLKSPGQLFVKYIKSPDNSLFLCPNALEREILLDS